MILSRKLQSGDIIFPVGLPPALQQPHWAWAVEGGIPDMEAEFELIRPEMAMTFPFELDNFQKEVRCGVESRTMVKSSA